jgi:dTMP kinase
LAHGRFITLEGGEGVGKSTLAAGLKAALVSRGHDVLLTREPGGTPGAEALRSVILSPPDGVGDWSPLTETLLFYAARTDHLRKRIQPHVEAGGWVVCDRFSDSTRAYQAAAGGAPAETIETLDRLCVGDWTPHLTLILDLPLSAARERLATRGQTKDAIESRVSDYHERVRAAFLAIAKAEPRRCVVLDASRTAADVLAGALDAIDARLGSA